MGHIKKDSGAARECVVTDRSAHRSEAAGEARRADGNLGQRASADRVFCPAANKPLAKSISIELADPHEAQIARLLQRSRAHSHALYPPEGVHALQAGGLAERGAIFVVARETGAVLGCGAIVVESRGIAEIKSLFVDAPARGRGIGGSILGALEELARSKQVRCLRLETGPRQLEAIALYRRFGYLDRGPFGTYSMSPFSLFMEKTLE